MYGRLASLLATSLIEREREKERASTDLSDDRMHIHGRCTRTCARHETRCLSLSKLVPLDNAILANEAGVSCLREGFEPVVASLVEIGIRASRKWPVDRSLVRVRSEIEARGGDNFFFSSPKTNQRIAPCNPEGIFPAVVSRERFGPMENERERDDARGEQSPKPEIPGVNYPGISVVSKPITRRGIISVQFRR